ncbi:MAG TPA: methyltransferase domain-containing protein [candidate division Zixibacteria bacterium]|nr:methyltransferase domain-containing protein [candidate division Zixibacteria bacterium]
MEEYYRKWAPDYERFYYECEPAIKQGNKKTAELLTNFLDNRSVLEIACGTGYWTKILSSVAKQIVATDILPEVLYFAKQKKYSCPVLFTIVDAYNLHSFKQTFDGGLANFWFSHIPKDRIDSFLEGFHRALQPKSYVFICDNNPKFLPDGRLISFPNDPNTYRLRTTSDNSEHYVLKNYYTTKDLISIFSKHVKNFDESNIKIDEYFWRVAYKL